MKKILHFFISDRKSTRLNSSHSQISYAVFCLKKKIIVVHPEMPWRSAKELLEEVKRRPGEIVFASSGIYGASHVPMEMLLQAAGGLRMRHLPTTGGGPATTAVLGGHAQLWCSPPGVASPHIKSGKLRPLAGTGAARAPNFSHLPTPTEPRA